MRPIDRQPPIDGRYLLDIDGVCYLRGNRISGAPEAVSAIKAAGGSVVFVTNNSSQTPDVFARMLGDAGIAADPGEVVTSSTAAASLLQLDGQAGQRALLPGADVAVMGGEGVVAAMARGGFVPVDVEEALARRGGDGRLEALVVGIDRALTYERLAAAADLVRAGVRFIATNTDATYPTEVGLLPGAGAIVAAVAAASGVDPNIEVAGKPERGLAIAARAIVGGGFATVIGDRIETDIEFARRWGFASALVLSGVSGTEDLLEATVLPDWVARDLAGVFDGPVRIETDPDGRARVVDGVGRLAEEVADVLGRRQSVGAARA